MIDHQENALLWHFRLDGSGGVLNDNAPEDETAFHWVHLRSDATDVLEEMAKLDLPHAVIEGLVATETRPRTLISHNGVMMYLRAINKNPGSEPEDMVSLRLWLSDKLIVTTRRSERKLFSVLDVKGELEAGEGPTTPGQLVTSLVNRIASRIGETVDEIEDSLEDLETQLTEENSSIDRHYLATLRRRSAAIRRYLAPQRDALDTLYRTQGFLSDRDAFDLREQTDRVTRYVEDLDLARERAVLLSEELRNLVAEKQGLRMYVLSLVTAVFLPLSFLTGVFGMNVAGLPGLEEPFAFNYLVGFMLVVSFVVIGLMAWRKWL